MHSLRLWLLVVPAAAVLALTGCSSDDTGGNDGGKTGSNDAGQTGGGNDSGQTGGTACATPNQGCTTYTDLTASGATRTINYPGVAADGGVALVYNPNCIQVKAGQTVTFSGINGITFINHPLSQTCGPVDGVLSANTNNITKTFTMSTAGVYGFRCDYHGLNGGSMIGGINVVP